MIRELIVRVESTRPPGVRSVNTTKAAALSIGAIDRLNDVRGRDRVDEGIYFRRVHDRCRGGT